MRSPSWLAPTLHGYQRNFLRADVLGGCALAAVALPSQLATARLANLAPATGLLAFAGGALLYAVFGTSRHLAVGADSTIAPVLATGAAALALPGSLHYGATIAVASIAVGVLLIVVGLVRLGWIAQFLSALVIAGLLSGIGISIIVRQLAAIFGVASGGATTIGRISSLIHRLGRTNGWTLGLAVGIIVFVSLIRRIDRRLPGALIALVLAVVLEAALGLHRNDGVAVFGALHRGLPHFEVPSVSGVELRRLVGTVLTVTFVCIAQTSATLRSIPSEPDGASDINRDLLAIGAGSVVASFTGGFAVDASPPVTAIASTSGGRTQLASVTAAVLALVLAAFAMPALADLPKAALGAVLIVIASRLFRFTDLRAVLHFDRLEFALATATLLCVAIVGIEQGVVLAMILSLADRTRREARPRDAVLGREPGSDHWIPTDIGKTTEQVPGILVYLVYAPLWYGDAEYVCARIRGLVDAAEQPLHAIVVDADAMSDIDFTGLEALRGIVHDLSERSIVLAVARASHLVHHDLKHGALLNEIGANHFYASIDEAVISLSRPS